MKAHLVVDGNAFYEIDDDCVRRKEQEQEVQRRKKQQEQEVQRRKKQQEQK